MARNLLESSSTLETCPYLHNAPCIFVELSYSALMACTSCQVVFLPHFEEVKVPVSNSVEVFPKSAPWRILEDLGVVRVKRRLKKSKDDFSKHHKLTRQEVNNCLCSNP